MIVRRFLDVELPKYSTSCVITSSLANTPLNIYVVVSITLLEVCAMATRLRKAYLSNGWPRNDGIIGILQSCIVREEVIQPWIGIKACAGIVKLHKSFPVTSFAKLLKHGVLPCGATPRWSLCLGRGSKTCLSIVNLTRVQCVNVVYFIVLYQENQGLTADKSVKWEPVILIQHL